MADKKPQTVDEYIASFPADSQKLLQQMRETIRKAAPDAEEMISYGLATYKLHGNLVHFGGFKNHLGFYPVPSGIEAFKEDLAPYATAKGSAQFPLDKPLPLGLVKRIVAFRVKENIEAQFAKKAKAALSKKPVLKKAASKKAAVTDFKSRLSAPAQRALQDAGINTLKQLAKHTEAQILKLHGMGPASIPKLREALKQEGLYFKEG